MKSRTLPLLLSVAAATLLHAQPRDLTMYWVDVEGGAATLIVTPSGQSLLVDSGNPGDRDAKRIFETAQLAGLKKIDMLVTTHYHGDHVGGLGALVKLIPVDRFYDHGDSKEAPMSPRAAQTWETYKGIVEGKRVVVKPGDKIPLKGVDITVVSADGEVIQKALVKGAGPNPLCEGAEQKAPDPRQPENTMSVGTLVTYGKFRFLNLGDLTWDRELMLACPVNKIGMVSLFQATHHGFFNLWSGAPPLVWAIKPQVVIVANGPTKGLPAGGYETIAKIPGIEAIWQGHRATANDDAHNTSEPMIANLDATKDETKSNLIKATVSKDGKFTITNERNGYSKTYTAR